MTKINTDSLATLNWHSQQKSRKTLPVKHQADSDYQMWQYMPFYNHGLFTTINSYNQRKLHGLRYNIQCYIDSQYIQITKKNTDNNA